MSIPIYILCRDRLACTKALVSWCEQFSYLDIVLVDSGSTYVPLLEWLTDSPHRVVSLGGNRMAAGAMEIVHRDGSPLYVFTDPDVVPQDRVPHDWLSRFVDGMSRHNARRVGFSLDISCLPKHYAYREDVYRIESPYWLRPIGQFFEANVDTTFALYSQGHNGISLRSNYPYVADHTTWHLDVSALPPDEQWYMDHAPVCAHYHGERCTELGRMNRDIDGGPLTQYEWSKVAEIAYIASQGDFDWRYGCPTRSQWLANRGEGPLCE